jgi:hypothetical protein
MNDTVIILFTFNRVDLTRSIINSLINNINSESYDLIIYSDAAKLNKDINKVQEVRDYIQDIGHFNSVKSILRDVNLGLAKSIISGVSKAFEQYEKAIILEDDLILSSNFLAFMQQGLDTYQDNTKVLNISGFSYENKVDASFDNFFWGRATSWGWATWKDRWEMVNWSLPYNSERELRNATKGFNKFGYDLTKMLLKQYNHEINSWAIRWCLHQHQYQLLSVVPVKSKVSNHGFGDDATHCKDKREIKIEFDNGEIKEFTFDLNPLLNRKVYKSYINNYSIWNKIKSKILGSFIK